MAIHILALAFVACGPPLLIAAWRLIANRPRRDGVFALVETASELWAAGGCFALARYRERHMHSEFEELATGGDALSFAKDQRGSRHS